MDERRSGVDNSAAIKTSYQACCNSFRTHSPTCSSPDTTPPQPFLILLPAVYNPVRGQPSYYIPEASDSLVRRDDPALQIKPNDIAIPERYADMPDVHAR